MAITHIVLVSFKPGTGAQEMDRVRLYNNYQHQKDKHL